MRVPVRGRAGLTGSVTMISPRIPAGRPLAALLAACVLAGPSAALALTLDDALRLAASEAPSLQAQSARVEAARNAAIPADALPDPKLVLGVQSLPIEKQNRWSLTDDSMTMQMYGLMQEVPNRAKRRARAEAASAGIDRAAAERHVELLKVRAQTAQAWIAAHTVERKLALFDELLAENRLLDRTVKAQIAGGQGQAADAVAPRQEAALLAERRDELEQQRAQARASLRRWIGAAADEPLDGHLPAWRADPHTYSGHLQSHPELLAYGPKLDEAKARIDEAVAQKRPDWSWEVDYLRRGQQFGDMVNLKLTVDLPVFPGSRQNPTIAARHAEYDQLQAEREAMEREHAELLAFDLAEQQRLSRARQRYQDSLLPLAREKVELSMAGYRSGKGGLNDVLTARRELLEARLKQIDLEGLEAIAGARLHFAYGDSL